MCITKIQSTIKLQMRHAMSNLRFKKYGDIIIKKLTHKYKVKVTMYNDIIL